jgi:hypothetical protein
MIPGGIGSDFQRISMIQWCAELPEIPIPILSPLLLIYVASHTHTCICICQHLRLLSIKTGETRGNPEGYHSGTQNAYLARSAIVSDGLNSVLDSFAIRCRKYCWEILAWLLISKNYSWTTTPAELFSLCKVRNEIRLEPAMVLCHSCR